MRKARVDPLEEGERGSVRAVTRALRLLEALSFASRSLKLCGLARQQELPPATCLRLLTTMQERGFVRFDAKTASWTIGATALFVGANFAATRHIINVAEPIIRHFSADHHATVNLGLLDGAHVRFLYRVTPGKPPSAPEEQIPAHCSAIGKAVLSGLPPIEAHTMLGGMHLCRLTRNSLAERHLLFDDLERAHEAGYAIDNEENRCGLCCVAAPIFDEHFRPVAAISIARSVQHLWTHQAPSFGRELVVAAERIMLRFGGRRPSL
jgi:IclR family transcriptional regulator, acetate operon repressor